MAFYKILGSMLIILSKNINSSNTDEMTSVRDFALNFTREVWILEATTESEGPKEA